jgi:hypothetical protein
MTREPDKNKPAGTSRGGGGRGAGGPPPNVAYGGQARQAYIPPGQGARPAVRNLEDVVGGKKPEPAPAKRMPAARSKYGSTAPLKQLTPARIFESAYVVQLAKPPYGDPTGEWPMYVSTQKLPDTADRGAINGIYIHRTWLPDPPPEKLRVKFEPA